MTALRDALEALRRERDDHAAALVKLDAALAALEGIIETGPIAVVSPSKPSGFECPDCGKNFAKGQGLGAHRNKAHGYRSAKRPRAKNAALHAPSRTCAADGCGTVLARDNPNDKCGAHSGRLNAPRFAS